MAEVAVCRCRRSSSPAPLAVIDASRFEFAFVTTGDDDIGRDCNHESFGFTVTVPYLTP